MAIEETAVTEFAALGVAHIIFPELIGKKIERTQTGSKVDYWVGDEKEALLEVSGIYKGKSKTETRVKEKVIQLKKSPFYNGLLDKLNGYVSVTHFENKTSTLKYISKI